MQLKVKIFQIQKHGLLVICQRKLAAQSTIGLRQSPIEANITHWSIKENVDISNVLHISQMLLVVKFTLLVG